MKSWKKQLGKKNSVTWPAEGRAAGSGDGDWSTPASRTSSDWPSRLAVSLSTLVILTPAEDVATPTAAAAAATADDGDASAGRTLRCAVDAGKGLSFDAENFPVEQKNVVDFRRTKWKHP